MLGEAPKSTGENSLEVSFHTASRVNRHFSQRCSETGQRVVTLPVDEAKGQVPGATEVFCKVRTDLALRTWMYICNPAHKQVNSCLSTNSGCLALSPLEALRD